VKPVAYFLALWFAPCSTTIAETMAETMPLFPNFPIEVRLQIWQCAVKELMETPRIVRHNWPYKESHPRSENNPTLLYVNKESRQEALTCYNILQGNNELYINFKKDIVFWDSGSRSQHELSSWAARNSLYPRSFDIRTRYLAIDHAYFLNNCSYLLSIEWLEELIVVIEPDSKEANPAVLVKFTELNEENYIGYRSCIERYSRLFSGQPGCHRPVLKLVQGYNGKERALVTKEERESYEKRMNRERNRRERNARQQRMMR